jgi:hypothetical protein
LSLVALALCFMPQPIEDEVWPLADLALRTEDGRALSAEEYQAGVDALKEQLRADGDAEAVAGPPADE